MPYESPFYSLQSTFCASAIPSHGGNSAKADSVSAAFFENGSAPRINTDVYVYNAIKGAYPDVDVIDTDPYQSNILGYLAATADGEIQSLSDSQSNATITLPDDHPLKEKRTFATSLNWLTYRAPARRLDGGAGTLSLEPIFDRFLVKWQKHEFLIYIVDARDGEFMSLKRQYILTTENLAAQSLVRKAGTWTNSLHEEIWVFNQGGWFKDRGLYQAIQKSEWENIILPSELKEDLLDTVTSFFDSRETYAKLRVPWKRGLIFYGPPGNGKTISIKATMKTLFDRNPSVPTLYVKSLQSYAGPEYSINQIFSKARQQAPCYLVFEDLDSMVTEEVRYFFLNALDGLSENEGILIVGSTNHLERLDPGIAKRPSRFDRKYLFNDPDMEMRTRYCHFWQTKLKDNDQIDFPNKLCPAIAGLTDGFSFAYMQEAFISTLLKIANDSHKPLKTKRDAHEYNTTLDLTDLDGELDIIEKDELTAAENKVTALYDYDASDDDEVSFKAGDEIALLERALSDDWWLVRNVRSGKVGYAPRNFLSAHASIDFMISRGDDHEDLNKYLLWREIKDQIKNLRKEIDQER